MDSNIRSSSLRDTWPADTRGGRQTLPPATYLDDTESGCGSGPDDSLFPDDSDLIDDPNSDESPGILLSLLKFFTGLEPDRQNSTTNLSIVLGVPGSVIDAMGLGFLGALVFCFNMLWQRLTTEDLKPTVFLRCALALFCGMAFNFVVFSAGQGFVNGFGSPPATATAGDSETPDTPADPQNLTQELKGPNAVMGYIVAFSLGYFPMLAIRWFTRVAHHRLGEPLRRSDAQRLTLVDGVTLFHEERLLEEGIHTVHDLAHADVGRVLINTPYPVGQIEDWVGQARILLMLESAEADRLRLSGVRTDADVVRMLSDSTGNCDPEKLKNLAAASLIPEARLSAVFDRLVFDTSQRSAAASAGGPPADQSPDSSTTATES